MLENKISIIFLSVFIAAGGAAGGCAITYELAGYDTALSFLVFGESVVFALLVILIITAIKSEKRSVHLILFNIAFIFGLVWFMLCVVLPIFWIPTVGMSRKFFLSLVSTGLCYANLFKGIQNFKSRWSQVGPGLLSQFYDRKSKEIDWEGAVAKLRMSVSIYIPGVPSQLTPFISVAIIVSMIVGLCLYNVFPLFSFFAWGIPTMIVVSLVMQMIGSGIGQFLVVTSLERKDSSVIRPLKSN